MESVHSYLRHKAIPNKGSPSILVQVMAWCRQASSHYLNQCWLRSILPYGVTTSQCVIYGVLISVPNKLCHHRARHLFFPQLDSRTTIKQYGLVRNRNLLGHDNNILPFSIKKIGENYIYICIFNFYFKITVSEAHYHTINHWYSSLEVVFFYFCPFWRHRDQEYI